VRAFIPEHHGTRLVTYFYRMAQREKPDADPADYTYPGPKPQSKETALVMLADSTEAVVRASQDRSQETIDALVESVIAERMTEGQFDECDLTLRDLRVIAASFKSSLRAIYHLRIEYPAAITRPERPPATEDLTSVPADHIGGDGAEVPAEVDAGDQTPGPVPSEVART